MRIDLDKNKPQFPNLGKLHLPSAYHAREDIWGQILSIETFILCLIMLCISWRLGLPDGAIVFSNLNALI